MYTRRRWMHPWMHLVGLARQGFGVHHGLRLQRLAVQVTYRTLGAAARARW